MKPLSLVISSLVILLLSCNSESRSTILEADIGLVARADTTKHQTKVVQSPTAPLVDTIVIPNETTAVGRVHHEGGVFHDGEVIENIEALEWVGLFNDKQGYYLKRTAIKTGREKDEIVDDGDEISGWTVNTGNPDNCTLLINLSPGFQEHRVDTFIFKKDVLWPGETVNIKTNTGTYTLRATGRVTSKTEEWQEVENYKLYLEGNVKGKKTTQLIVAIPRFDDYITRILWCGDLDQDGKPDFIIDSSYHYNMESLSLFLSSKATSGQLLRYIGTHSITGC
jgi:hypothetical protein